MRKLFQPTTLQSYSYLPDNSSIKQTNNLFVFIAFSTLIIMCLIPEISLATTLENQLDKVGVLASGKFKTIGLTAATIGGSIWSVVKGNLKLTAIIIAIGITLSLYLEWVKGGMQIA